MKRTSKSVILVMIGALIIFLSVSIFLDVKTLQSCTEPIQSEFVKYSRSGCRASTLRAYYKYTYDGRSYELRSTNSTVLSSDRIKGEMYTIYLNPDKPEIFKDISGDISVSVFLNFILCMVLVFCFSLLCEKHPDKVVYHIEYPLGKAVEITYDKLHDE